MAIYVVQNGDTIDNIAYSNGASVENIIYDNQLVYPYQLAVGQALYLRENDTEGNYAASLNGYAYPFISRWVLQQSLPYLSELSIFSYGFTTEGELVYPALDDQWMIIMAREYATRPILTLTPLGPDGRFSNNLIHAMLINEEAKSRLIAQLLQTVQEKGYSGTDIDFEYIYREDRELFTDFVARVTQVMNENGYQNSVAMAPKTSATQQGLLYEGKDYGGLGAAGNHVLLMTYEYGYKYGPNLAVAPINQVRNVVDYALTEIPADKIDLGIPNYGYDWPLPYVRGETVARTIGNIEAVRIAISKGAEIKFDELSQSPYFNYIEQGIEHEVWFEDVRSYQSKFNMIKEKGLRGAGYWHITQLFRANWLLADQNFAIEKNL